MNNQMSVSAVPASERALPPVSQPLSITEIRNRKDLVTQVMREVMIEGQHYGKIPGTDSKALYKPGAEMLGMTFRLHAHLDVQTKDLDDRGQHREFVTSCSLIAADGTTVAVGMGSCSTMESKYRWRWSKPRCPGCNAEAIKTRRDGGGWCDRKSGGCGINFEKGDRALSQPSRRFENPDIADQWNTCLKMANKRAHAAAILLATGASDMFAQEEEAPADLDTEEPPPKQQAAASDEKQQLATECAKLATQLDRSKEDIFALLEQRGAFPPKNGWTKLSAGELKKAHDVMAEELNLTKGGA